MCSRSVSIARFFTRVEVSLEGKGAQNNYEESSWTLASANRGSRGFLWSHPGDRADNLIPIEVNAKNQDATPDIASGSPRTASSRGRYPTAFACWT
jgi:hypothetical protein